MLLCIVMCHIAGFYQNSAGEISSNFTSTWKSGSINRWVTAMPANLHMYIKSLPCQSEGGGADSLSSPLPLDKTPAYTQDQR